MFPSLTVGVQVGRAISRQPLSGAALPSCYEKACFKAGCRLNSPPHMKSADNPLVF
jgi:hypothetical protein